MEKHRWAIDSIEEFIASVEVDGGKVVQVPQWLLPTAAKEGEMLSVSHRMSADGETSSLEIKLDRAATKAAQERSAAVPKKTGAELGDPGGDIKL